MLRPESSSESEPTKQPNPGEPSQDGASGLDIQAELNLIEEIILSSPRIPLTGRTLVDEEKLLDQLDLVRMKLPVALAQAEEILRQKLEIGLKAEKYAREIVESAEARVAQLLKETNIFQQAELEARQKLDEAAQMRRQVEQELEDMRSVVLGECAEIQQGADAYADGVLKNIEQQLNDMLRVIQNGRQKLQSDPD